MITELQDRDYLAIAYQNAVKSPDPRTQNGSVLVPANRYYNRARGHNDAIRGASFDWLHPTEKYELIHHAEEMAVLEAAKTGVPTRGATLYVPWYACMRCCRQIIGAEIARVVGHADLMTWAEHKNPSWMDGISQAFSLMEAAGVRCDMVEGPVSAPVIRHSGTQWDPWLLQEVTELEEAALA